MLLMFCIQQVRKLSPLLKNESVINSLSKQNFWQWLTFVFNRVSKSRIKEVGPDRACAEWLMRNGALVRWKGHSKFVTHYDNLPKDQDPRQFYIQEVDATDAAISRTGFQHFKDCKHIECIKFDNCQYLENSALNDLTLIKGSLESLLIYRCPHINDKGILSLANLLKLKTLEMGELNDVKDIKGCLKTLELALPSCNITVK